MNDEGWELTPGRDTCYGYVGTDRDILMEHLQRKLVLGPHSSNVDRPPSAVVDRLRGNSTQTASADHIFKHI